MFILTLWLLYEELYIRSIYISFNNIVGDAYIKTRQPAIDYLHLRYAIAILSIKRCISLKVILNTPV